MNHEARRTQMRTTIGVVTTALLAACASDPQPYAGSPQQYPSQQYPSQQYPNQQYPAPQYPAQGMAYMTGTVDRIEVINRGDTNNIAGTVIGGIIGGLIGHQIGGGTGNTVATVVGAGAGAVAGNQVQRQRAPHETFRVTIRM